jgi:hypothetical protein
MPKVEIEVREERNRDEEGEKLRKNCRTCGEKNVVLIRRGTEGNSLTQTLIAVCTKPTCHRYVDLDQVTMWVRKGG